MFWCMSRVVVSREKLRTALTIWLRVMPSHVWRRYEAYERKMAEKRHAAEDAPKAREEMAEYLASRFDMADWEITHPEPVNHG
jgi:hypothetical protein